MWASRGRDAGGLEPPQDRCLMAWFTQVRRGPTQALSWGWLTSVEDRDLFLITPARSADTTRHHHLTDKPRARVDRAPDGKARARCIIPQLRNRGPQPHNVNSLIHPARALDTTERAMEPISSVVQPSQRPCRQGSVLKMTRKEGVRSGCTERR